MTLTNTNDYEAKRNPNDIGPAFERFQETLAFFTRATKPVASSTHGGGTDGGAFGYDPSRWRTRKYRAGVFDAVACVDLSAAQLADALIANDGDDAGDGADGADGGARAADYDRSNESGSGGSNAGMSGGALPAPPPRIAAVAGDGDGGVEILFDADSFRLFRAAEPAPATTPTPAAATPTAAGAGLCSTATPLPPPPPPPMFSERIHFVTRRARLLGLDSKLRAKLLARVASDTGAAPLDSSADCLALFEWARAGGCRGADDDSSGDDDDERVSRAAVASVVDEPGTAPSSATTARTTQEVLTQVYGCGEDASAASLAHHIFVVGGAPQDDAAEAEPRTP